MFDSTSGYAMSNQRLKVPLKLLHINETSYTDEWAKDNYKYHHFFDETLNESRPLAGERDLKEWKAKAILMTHEIKQRGMIAGRYELCRVAKEDYGLTIPGRLDSNSHCTDIDDILCVVTNPDWYYDDINQKRNIIYHFIYGLTRPGNNIWLINAEKKWMEHKGIVYDYDSLPTKKKTRVKGFVYSIMQSMFSNYVQKTFRKRMFLHFNEFVTVREKNRNPSNSSKYHYQKHQFGNNNGYIVSRIGNDIEETNLSLPKLLNAGKNWVNDCKSQGYSLEMILKSAEGFYHGKKLFKVGAQDKVNRPNAVKEAVNSQLLNNIPDDDCQLKEPSDNVLKHLKQRHFHPGTLQKNNLFRNIMYTIIEHCCYYVVNCFSQ